MLITRALSRASLVAGLGARGAAHPAAVVGATGEDFLISLELFLFRFTLGKKVRFSLVYSLSHLHEALLVFSSLMRVG